jgi:NhaA family Na+:H+ antiporter
VFAEPQADDDVHETEHVWHEAVQVVLFFFGLVNAGVLLRGADTGSWALLTASLVGRPVGILMATALAVAIGLRLPKGVGWREVVVVALATTSGFTFVLFLSVQLLPIGAVLTQIKIGALLTTVGAIVTFAVAALLHVGRRRIVHA